MRGERRGTRTVSIGAHKTIAQESGTFAANVAPGGVAVKVGGTLHLVAIHAIRPGETIQGFRGSLNYITNGIYSVTSPRPIYIGGAYLVTMATLPESLKNVYIDRTRAIDAELPIEFSAACFKEVYNNYYAADDYVLSSTAEVIDAPLPPIIRTMEVIADDETQPTYSEWIYLQTGRYPMQIGIERLAQHTVRSTAMYHQMLPGVSKALCHFGASLPFRMVSNRATTEPGFLVFVGGFFHEPNNTSLYGGLDPWDDSPATQDTIFDTDKLRNADAWLQRQIQGTSSGGEALGDIGSENVLNYFMNGDFTFHNDWDIEAYIGGALVGDPKMTAQDDEDMGETEGIGSNARGFSAELHLSVDASILSDLMTRESS